MRCNGECEWCSSSLSSLAPEGEARKNLFPSLVLKIPLERRPNQDIERSVGVVAKDASGLCKNHTSALLWWVFCILLCSILFCADEFSSNQQWSSTVKNRIGCCGQDWCQIFLYLCFPSPVDSFYYKISWKYFLAAKGVVVIGKQDIVYCVRGKC